MLDLEMPISNGFEACSKIYSLFNKESIFTHTKKVLVRSISKDQCSSVSSPNNNGKEVISHGRMDLIQLNKPKLIACSSSVLTKTLQDKLKKCGFDLFVEAPISNEEIENLVADLQVRNEQINGLNLENHNNSWAKGELSKN
jgi:CheY-like chemotaxis protein